MNRTDLLKISLEMSDLALLDLGTRMTVNEDDSIDIHLDREKGESFIELLEGVEYRLAELRKIKREGEG